MPGTSSRRAEYCGGECDVTCIIYRYLCGGVLMLRLSVIVCAGLVSAAFAQTNTNWNGGTGTWSAPNWDNGVPNNSGPVQFNAIINSGAGDNVTLDINPVINN